MKPKITVDVLHQIIEGVFKTYNYTIDDPSNEEFNEKKILDVLNVKYYKFKHRLTDRDKYIEEFKERIASAFCLVELNPNLNIEFTNKMFMAAPSMTLTYMIPTSKVPLLDDFISYCNSEVTGESFTTTIGTQTIKVKMFLGALVETDVQQTSFMGEASRCTLSVSFVLSDEFIGFEDYSFRLGFINEEGEEVLEEFNPIYIGGDRGMVPKSLPMMNIRNASGQVNLSNTQVFAFKFYAKPSGITSELSNMVYNDEIENNKEFILEITRYNTTTKHKVIVANISSTCEDGVGYELFSVTFAKGGRRNGT